MSLCQSFSTKIYLANYGNKYEHELVCNLDNLLEIEEG